MYNIYQILLRIKSKPYYNTSKTLQKAVYLVERILSSTYTVESMDHLLATLYKIRPYYLDKALHYNNDRIDIYMQRQRNKRWDIGKLIVDVNDHLCAIK